MSLSHLIVIPPLYPSGYTASDNLLLYPVIGSRLDCQPTPIVIGNKTLKLLIFWVFYIQALYDDLGQNVDYFL